MSDKSHVSMERKVCPICGEEHDSGAILIDQYLRNQFERTTVTGWGMCKLHQEQHDDGYVFLIGVKDDGKTKLTLENANRTGKYCAIRKSAFEKIMNAPLPPNGIAFGNDDIFDALQKLVPHGDT